jgi:hypothetical protein
VVYALTGAFTWIPPLSKKSPPRSCVFVVCGFVNALNLWKLSNLHAGFGREKKQQPA